MTDKGTRIHSALKRYHAQQRQGEVDAVLSLNGQAPAQPAPLPFTPSPEYTLRRQMYHGRYWWCVYVKHPRLPVHLLALRREKAEAITLLARLRSGTVNGEAGADVPF